MCMCVCVYMQKKGMKGNCSVSSIVSRHRFNAVFTHCIAHCGFYIGFRNNEKRTALLRNMYNNILHLKRSSSVRFIYPSQETESTLGVSGLQMTTSIQQIKQTSPNVFFLTSLPYFICSEKQKQTLYEVLIPSTSNRALCLNRNLQKYLQAGLQRKNTRRALYNSLRQYQNKSKRQRRAFTVKLALVSSKFGDGVAT